MLGLSGREALSSVSGQYEESLVPRSVSWEFAGWTRATWALVE